VSHNTVAEVWTAGGSEVEFQAKLDEAGVAHRIIDNAEARIVLDTTSSVRSAELGTVEEVEELGTELYVVPELCTEFRCRSVSC